MPQKVTLLILIEGRADVEQDSTGINPDSTARRRNILTNSALTITMHLYTMVEVANVISTVLELAIAKLGKGPSPKDAVFCQRAVSWDGAEDVPYCHRFRWCAAMGWSCCFAPYVCDMGRFFVRCKEL